MKTCKTFLLFIFCPVNNFCEINGEMFIKLLFLQMYKIIIPQNQDCYSAVED